MSRGLGQGGKATWTIKSRDMAEHPQHRHTEAWTGCGEGGWRPWRLALVGIALATPCRHIISTDATTLGAQRALVASVTAGRPLGAAGEPASARTSRTSPDFKPGGARAGPAGRVHRTSALEAPA